MLIIIHKNTLSSCIVSKQLTHGSSDETCVCACRGNCHIEGGSITTGRNIAAFPDVQSEFDGSCG